MADGIAADAPAERPFVGESVVEAIAGGVLLVAGWAVWWWEDTLRVLGLPVAVDDVAAAIPEVVPVDALLGLAGLAVLYSALLLWRAWRGTPVTRAVAAGSVAALFGLIAAGVTPNLVHLALGLLGGGAVVFVVVIVHGVVTGRL